jgi:hypothetical protein
MHEPDGDPYELALDELRASGLTPRPIAGYRAGLDGVGIIEHRGELSADEGERVARVMGNLPYVLDEVTTDADGVMRRAAGGRVLGRWLRRKPDSTV